MPVSRPEKELWAGVTKGDLARYLGAVAPVMLPHIEGRALSVVRMPNGPGEEMWFQKHAPKWAPDWLPRVRLPSGGPKGPITFLMAAEARHLVWFAGQAAVEFHVTTSPSDEFSHPDQFVLDIDPPPEAPIAEAVDAAHALRAALAEHGLDGAAKTSGGKGLHIHVPIVRGPAADDVRQVARHFCHAVADAQPERYTVEMLKVDRHGRTFLDWTRNGAAMSAVAPWSPRAREGAPVAMPLRWEEVTHDLDPHAFTVLTALERATGGSGLASGPWDGVWPTEPFSIDGLPRETSPEPDRFGRKPKG